MSDQPARPAKRQNTGTSLDLTTDEGENKSNFDSSVQNMLFPFPVKGRQTRMSVMLAQHSNVVRTMVELKQRDEPYPALDNCGLTEQHLQFVNKMLWANHVNYAEELKDDVENLKICKFLFKYDIPYNDAYQYFIDLMYKPIFPNHGKLYSCTDLSFLCDEDPIIHACADSFANYVYALTSELNLSKKYMEHEIVKFCNHVLENLVWKNLALKLCKAK